MSSDDEEDITGPIISQFRNQVMAKSTPLAKKDKCAQDALSQMDSLSINEIANIFFACGRSGYVHGELFVALASRAMRTQGMMVQMLPGNSRLMFQALALLGKLGDDALAPFTNRHDFCRALAAVTIKQERGRFMDSNEYNLTTTLHCVGVMHKHGLLGKGEAIKLVSALIYRLIAEGRIPRCTPQELANVLYGCAVVGYVGRSELKMVSEQIQCLLVVPRSSLRIINTKFNPPVASSIIWSLGKLGMSDGLRIDTLGEKVLELLSDMTGRELVEVLHGFVSLDYNNKDVLNRLCVEVVKPTRLISLTTQELANLLYAVSRLGYEEDMLGDLVKEITKPKRLVELSRPAVCTVVQSLGQMESLPREIVGPLLEEIMDPRRLEMAREQCDRHLCSFVFGLGLMQRHIHDTTLFTSITWFLDDVRVMSATRDLSCRDVACMAWGLSQLRFYNSWFMDRLAAQFLRAMETQNSERIERDALMFLHSCALLHHHHHKFLSFITKHVEAYAQIMNDVRSVATAIWGLAVLGYLDKGLFAILCSRVLLLGPIDRADSAMQILQGWHAVTKGRRGRKQQNENHFENIVVDLVETAQNVVRDLRQPSGMSQFEIEVVQAMKEFGLVFRQKVNSPLFTHLLLMLTDNCLHFLCYTWQLTMIIE